MSWILGIGFSLVAGQFAVEYFLRELRKFMQLGEKPEPASPIKSAPAWLTGGLERLFFTFLVAFQVAGTPAAMIGWLALKLATRWSREPTEEGARARAFAFSALLAGLLSMLIALLGGEICAY
jgi:hypothetical protein